MLEYKGYQGAYETDFEAGVMHGRLQGIRAVVTFESDNVEGLKREFEASVDSYLAMCEARGLEPEKPFSGRFNVRVSPDLHRAIVAAARADEVSMNEFIERTLADAVNPPASVHRAQHEPGEKVRRKQPPGVTTVHIPERAKFRVEQPPGMTKAHVEQPPGVTKVHIVEHLASATRATKSTARKPTPPKKATPLKEKKQKTKAEAAARRPTKLQKPR